MDKVKKDLRKLIAEIVEAPEKDLKDDARFAEDLGIDSMKALEIVGLGFQGSGAGSVERGLARLRGVVRAYVSPATETAYVEYDPARIALADLRRALADLGYGSGELRSAWLQSFS